jgi:hypothetical protein
MPRHSPPHRPAPKRSLKLAVWSLVVTLLILVWKLLPAMQEW